MWQSICWGQKLLKKGSRWWVGSGVMVSIFVDPCLPRLSTFKVITSKGCAALKVIRKRFGILKSFIGVCFKDFYSISVDRLDKSELALLYVFMWRVWFMRNQDVNKQHEVKDVVLWSWYFLSEFIVVSNPGENHARHDRLVIPCYHPPREGVYKLNIDTVVDSQNRWAGLGMIIRNHLAWHQVLRRCRLCFHLKWLRQ
ncbi:hypothetical protein Dsin_017125 [Dipteronia sinensis]|uniref:Uncharacterized protein n=1 Tax=Dipteronia sinensis TaxID=43782 RepID=A0AAE0E692_9ROSI|nr:hypothetical protein Dsin_017125 [Dipteronia sinensis]